MLRNRLTTLGLLTLALLAFGFQQPAKRGLSLSTEDIAPPVALPGGNSGAVGGAGTAAISEDGFTIALPGNPTRGIQEVPNSGGALKLNYLASKKDSFGFFFAYVDYPAGPGAMVESAFDMARDRILTQAKGRLVSESSTNLNGHPGRETVMQTSDKQQQMKLYFVDSRLYMLLSEAPLAQAQAAEVNQFFASFQLNSR